MYRQSPSRNQRSKGVKVKYAVQICLLLAVSFWLIYQLKRSHDKKKEFDETEAKSSLRMHSNEKNSILGRKGIISQEDEIASMNGDKLHEPIEEDETVEEENKEEEDENKTEEEEEEENSKADEDEDKTEEDESKPEEDESKLEADEPEEKNVDHQQENTDADENEAREVDSSNGNVDNNKSTHEARDENYKADDASSAVTHEAGENVNFQTENSNEVKKDSEVEGGEIANVDQKSNVAITETNLDALKGSENSSPPNDTLVIEKSSRSLEINGSTDVGTENRDLSETKNVMDHDLQASGIDSNSTDSTGTKDAELQKLENNSKKSLPSDSSAETENKTMPLSETEDEVEAEKSDLNDATNEKLESTVTENAEEEIQHDGIDESDVSESLEEKDVRTDLDTLPEIQTEGTIGDDDVAAE